MKQGGAIQGIIPINLATDKGVEIVATHENGISIEYWSRDDTASTFSISELWPGQWTVTVKRGEAEVLQKVVNLDGVETVTCDFVSE